MKRTSKRYFHNCPFPSFEVEELSLKQYNKESSMYLILITSRWVEALLVPSIHLQSFEVLDKMNSTNKKGFALKFLYGFIYFQILRFPIASKLLI